MAGFVINEKFYAAYIEQAKKTAELYGITVQQLFTIMESFGPIKELFEWRGYEDYVSKYRVDNKLPHYPLLEKGVR